MRVERSIIPSGRHSSPTCVRRESPCPRSGCDPAAPATASENVSMRLLIAGGSLVFSRIASVMS